jgi:hypothetical protein
MVVFVNISVLVSSFCSDFAVISSIMVSFCIYNTIQATKIIIARSHCIYHVYAVNIFCYVALVFLEA